MANLNKKLDNIFKEFEVYKEEDFKNLDSLDRMELITELEEEFEIDINEEEFEKVTNIEELKTFIEQKIEEHKKYMMKRYF